MKRGKKKKEAVAQAPVAQAPVAQAPVVEDVTRPSIPIPSQVADWDGPTRAGEAAELAELAQESVHLDADADIEIVAAAPAAPEGAEAEPAPAAPEGAEAEPAPVVESASRLESIIESLLYAADRPLMVSDLKRLVNERDTKKVTAALEALLHRHADTGIQLAALAGGWQFRTRPENGPWVAKLVAGRPQRLTRAMLEALSIVAYRQPITRPEIDEIRGVDCGPVLKTLLDRGFVRIIGKKEDVGRPLLYGTTTEFLRTFSLRDLGELPTLREFHELSEAQMASVDAKAPLPEGAVVGEGAPPSAPVSAARSPFAPAPMDLAPVDPDEEDDLLTQLDDAALAASRAAAPPAGSAEASGIEAAGPEAPDV
jgi:segregation and condensation protein B